MEQQVCLRWRNHPNNMVNVFGELLRDEALVDVTLACEDLTLKAHKIVLSACSPFFQSLFSDNPGEHPVVILKDIYYSELKALVDFMYHGQIYVSRDQIDKLLKSAEALKVKGLKNLLNNETFLKANSKSPTIVKLDAVGKEQEPKGSKRKRGRPRKRIVASANGSMVTSLQSDDEIEGLSDNLNLTSSTSLPFSETVRPPSLCLRINGDDNHPIKEDSILSTILPDPSMLSAVIHGDSILRNGESTSFAASTTKCRQLLLLPSDTENSVMYQNAVVPYTACRNTVCYECGRNFSTRGSLRRHQLLHTPVRGKFHCPGCPKAFSWPGDLQTHIRCFHPDIPKSDRKYKLHFRLKDLE